MQRKNLFAILRCPIKHLQRKKLIILRCMILKLILMMMMQRKRYLAILRYFNYSLSNAKSLFFYVA